MNIRSYYLLFMLLVARCCVAQINPAEGARLNYNQVMFEYDKLPGASVYLVQVDYDSVTSAFVAPVVEQRDSATATMISGLAFGKKYVWRYAALQADGKMVWQGPYHFQIVADAFISRGIISFNTTINDPGSSGLIVIDGTHTIVDRNGNLVWYLNNVNWFFKLGVMNVSRNGVTVTNKDMDITPRIFDLRLTRAGTVTCLKDSFAIEMGLDGKILWQAPNNGQINEVGGEGYNHDFKRLDNGHYMVLGDELWRRLPPYTDTIKMRKKYPKRGFFNGGEYAGVEFGTVIEYDKKGKILWSWRSRDYLDKDPFKPLERDRFFNFITQPHINAFSTDAKNEFVYVGFRDLCRIIKIEKSSGQVVDSWGVKVPTGGALHQVPIYLQHDANVLPDGNIAVFNSNDYPGRDSFASVLIISQQPADSGKVIWRLNCDFDSMDCTLPRNGGNVDLLKNGNYLVCMGNADRIFEVTKDKRIVWQGEMRAGEVDGIKYGHRLYRAHYISSLYPCYFTFVTGADTISKKKLQFNIRVFNKGSEDDSYHVKLTNARGKLLREFNTDTVAALKSVTLLVDAGEHISTGGKIEISIQSANNPDFERKRWVVVR